MLLLANAKRKGFIFPNTKVRVQTDVPHKLLLFTSQDLFNLNFMYRVSLKKGNIAIFA